MEGSVRFATRWVVWIFGGGCILIYLLLIIVNPWLISVCLPGFSCVSSSALAWMIATLWLPRTGNDVVGGNLVGRLDLGSRDGLFALEWARLVSWGDSHHIQALPKCHGPVWRGPCTGEGSVQPYGTLSSSWIEVAWGEADPFPNASTPGSAWGSII